MDKVSLMSQKHPRLFSAPSNFQILQDRNLFSFAFLQLITFFRLQPSGEPPSPRAAHAATAVGTMVVIQVNLGLFTFFSPLLNCTESAVSIHIIFFSLISREALAQLAWPQMTYMSLI